MKRFLIVAGALSLAGCSGYQAVADCRSAAGPEPHAGLKLFGLVGSLIMVSTPEYKAWASDVDGCVTRYREAQRR